MTSVTPPVIVRSVRQTSGSGITLTVPDDPVSFHQGRFTVLLGQNGSGKTTLLEAVLGIRTDYAVRRSVLGSDRLDLPGHIKRRIGVSTQAHSFCEGVRVRDVVRLHSGAYGVPTNVDLLDMFDLTKVLGSAYARTSGGQKKRLSLYFALAHDPEVAFLDEPEAGLDAQGMDAVLDRLDERSRMGWATVAATHDAMTVDRAGDVVFLKSGEIAYAGRKSAFVDRFLGESVLEVHIGGLSEAEVGNISGLGNARCLNGTGRLLLFGDEAGFARLLGTLDPGIGQRSILRGIRPEDMMAWINARKATECTP